jgi:hypothetical protein
MCLPEKRGFWTAHGAGIVAILLIEGITALVKGIDLGLVINIYGVRMLWTVPYFFSAFFFLVVCLLQAVCQYISPAPSNPILRPHLESHKLWDDMVGLF